MVIDEKKLTAKEMFEGLGWKQVTNEESYIVYQKGRRMISFIKNEPNGIVASSCHLTMNWLKAINKQCEELGWLDSKLSLENKTSDWIPCSERLPDEEDSTNVMVTIMDSITGKRWVEEDCYFYGVWCKSRELQDNIIAWCKPEPYKGDE